MIDEIKNSAAKKSTKITVKKILQKYKSMKRPKKTYLVNEEDLDTIDYNEPQEDFFRGESILELNLRHLKNYKKLLLTSLMKKIF